MLVLGDLFDKMTISSGAAPPRRDGLWFERVVKDLLDSDVANDLNFGAPWVHLSPQGGPDGARDFERIVRGRIEWAEAKNFAKNLSLKHLGPTLIIAKNDNVSRILVFSVSRLNANTEKHIAQYVAAEDIQIDVYQDEGLERLILDVFSDDTFFKHFGTTKPTRGVTQETELFTVYAQYSKDPDIRYWGDDEIGATTKRQRVGKHNLELHLGDVFCLDIFLMNRTLSALKGAVSIDLSDHPYLCFVTKAVRQNGGVIDVKLRAGEIKTMRVYLRADRSSIGSQSLPQVSFLSAQGERSQIAECQCETLNIHSFLQSPIVGVSHLAVLDQAKLAIQGSGRPAFIALNGRSGTGKTRLLRAVRDAALEEGYPVFLNQGENGHSSTSLNLLKDFVSRRFRIPPFETVPPFYDSQGQTWVAAFETTSQVVALFLRLPENELLRFPDVDDQAVKRMCEAGFLHLDENDELVFEHQTIQRYFLSRLKHPKRFAAFHRHLRAEGLDRYFRAQYLLCQAYIEKPDAVSLEEMARTLKTGEVPTEIQSRFIEAWSRQAARLGPNAYVLLLDQLGVFCSTLNRTDGFDKSLELYAKHFPRPPTLTTDQKSQMDGLKYVTLAVSYSSNLIRLRQDVTAHDLLLGCQAVFPDFTFANEADRLSAMAYLLDRLCVSHRSVGELKAARALGLEVCRIGKKLRAPYIRAQGHIEIGYTYYGNYGDGREASSSRSALTRHWAAGVRGEPEDCCPRNAVITHPRVFPYHRAHVCLLRGEYEQARGIIRDGIQECQRVFDAFHLVKYHLLFVLSHLLEGTVTEQVEECRLHLNRALDLCQAYRANQSYWLVFYADAICAELGKAAEVNWGVRDNLLLNSMTQLDSILQGKAAMYPRFGDFLKQSFLLLAQHPNSKYYQQALLIVHDIPDTALKAAVLGLSGGVADGPRLVPQMHSTYMREGYVLPAP